MSSSSNAYLGNQYQDKRKGLTETFVCVQRIRLSACDYNLARGLVPEFGTPSNCATSVACGVPP